MLLSYPENVSCLFCRTFNSAELLSDVQSMTCYQNICFCAKKKHSWKNYYFKLHKPVCQFVFHLLDFDLKDFIIFPAQYPITPHRIMFEGISFRSFVSICRFVCVYLSFFFFVHQARLISGKVLWYPLLPSKSFDYFKILNEHHHSDLSTVAACKTH